MTLSVLIFGDVVGKPGRTALVAALPSMVKDTDADCIIVNAENIAHGTGITEKTAKELLDAGVHVITTGDHAFKRKESQLLYENPAMPVIRPANFPIGTPGQSSYTIDVRTTRVTVVNLIGRVFMRNDYDDPFRAFDATVRAAGPNDILIVDMHAEATSEKVSLGWYGDGRVAAIVGTHTHIQTADERILPNGTAYITDVGMVGPRDGVLGVDRNIILKKFLTQLPAAHEVAEEGPVIVNAVHILIDPASKKATSITRLTKTVENGTIVA